MIWFTKKTEESMKHERRTAQLILCVLLVCGIFVTVHSDAYGDGDEGGGSDSGGVSASCSNHAFTLRCPTKIDDRGWEVNGDGSRGGGASWRIFKTSDASGLDSWTGYGGNILQDSYKNEAINTCKNVGWFASFGWDGMYDSHNGYSNFNYQIGPANRNPGNMIRSAYYNSYNAKDLNYLTTNSFPNNTKIYESTALALYRRLHPGVTAIPDDVGYFCVSGTKTLTAYAAVNGSYNAATDTRLYINKDGGITSNRDEAWKTSTTVKSGSGATVDVSEFNSLNNSKGFGYKWYNWGSSCAESERNGYSCVKSKDALVNSTTNVYAYYNLTLTAYANSLEKDASGNYIKLNGGEPIDQTPVKYNNNASVTSANFNPDGYSWYRWGDSCDRETGRQCTRNNLTANKKVYAYYYKNEFKGRVRAFDGTSTSGAVAATTGNVSDGYVGSSENKVAKIDCPESGCNATFDLYLKTVKGTGKTNYTVQRQKNAGTWNLVATTPESPTAPSTSGTSIDKKTGNYVENMHPGDVVCYRLNFTAVPANGTAASLTVCAAAVADEDSDINIKIMNLNGSVSYRSWRDDYVYAKPGDVVSMKATFSPRYQYLHDATISKINGRSSNGKKTIENAFNLYFNPSWNNAFSIDLAKSGTNKFDRRCYNTVNEGTDKEAVYNGAFFGTIGVSTSYDGLCGYNVSVSDVGEENKKEAKATINSRDRDGSIPTTKTTPKRVTLDYNSSDGFVATVDNGELKSGIVGIYVPYNFKNRVQLTMGDDEKFFAGQSKTIKYDLIVGAKPNSTTNGTYATNVPGAKWKLSVDYSDGVHSDINDYLGGVELNGSGGYNKDGKTESKTDSINIRDVPAGTGICVTVEFWPASSGSEENMATGGFSGWESDTKCYVVAKKPSLQVWGGSVYSAGSISLGDSVIEKNNLSDGRGDYLSGYEYSVKGSGNKRVFGTWTELGLVAGGAVTGVSSGAGWGYAQTSDALAAKSGGISGLGGSDETDFCKASTLSFANINCGSNVGNLGASSSQNDSSNKSGLISRFVGEDDEYERINNASGDISKVLGRGDDDVLTFEATNVKGDDGNDVLDEAGNVKKLATRVIDAGGNDIIIDKNILYGGSYSSLADVPKVIIYAENIKINCDVTRIDAVLIANKNVNTCAGDEKENSEDRSKQLMVNGSIIADTLTLGRTYGAATGVNSIVPAEIVNYDSSLYLWANRQANATKSGDLTEAYITELAPRY